MNINPQPYGIPVGIGQGYSTIALIPEHSGSWALPLRHERITSWDNPIDKGAQQLAQVCQYLQNRPISLFDSEYGCAPLVKATAAIAADKLMRIRSNRCLWSAPPAYGGKGRPKIHGQQFRLNDSQSWWEPEQTLESVEPKLGKIRLRKWDDLHVRGSPKHPIDLLRKSDRIVKQIEIQLIKNELRKSEEFRAYRVQTFVWCHSRNL